MAGSFLSKWFAHFGIEVPFCHTFALEVKPLPSNWTWHLYFKEFLQRFHLSAWVAALNWFILICNLKVFVASTSGPLLSLWVQTTRKIMFLNQGSALLAYIRNDQTSRQYKIYKQLLIMLSINGTNTTIMINPVLWITLWAHINVNWRNYYFIVGSLYLIACKTV